MVFSSNIPPREQIEIAKAVKQIKGQLLVGVETPIGSDLPMLLRRLGIILMEYPVHRAGSNSFSAIYVRAQVDGKPVCFLGLNTADYYDRQLFAIAHELYHFQNEGLPHISRDSSDGNPDEQRADWFAAELLLPLQVLHELIQAAFEQQNLSAVPFQSLIRFIAQVHCTWWLPYRSIVHRLYEAGAIDEDLRSKLFAIDERDPVGVYYRIGAATSPENFKLLNTVTNRTGTDGANLETCLRNYEDGIIAEDELFKGLQLFGVTPEDFGISFLPDDTSEEDDEPEAGGGQDAN